MRKTLSTSLCLTALSFAMLGGAVSPAAAQDTTAENAVTEIFVVAQRRTENLQDVPISATDINDKDFLPRFCLRGHAIFPLECRWLRSWISVIQSTRIC